MPVRYPKARLSPAKDEFIAFEFRRDEVERGELGRVLDLLSALTASRQAAEYGEGRLIFFFSGWDEDPREISEIPEIRAWFAKLTEAFPYWLHFAEKQGETLLNALMLLCRGETERTEPGRVGWRFADVKELTNLVLRLFAAQNGLYERLGLSEEMNERISEEVAQLIQCSLE